MFNQLPKELGRYWLVEKIGDGGEGVVYLAKRDDVEMDFAVKVFQKGKLFKDTEDAWRYIFGKKLSKIAGLCHEHILHIQDYGIDGEFCYVVTRYIMDGSLRDHLERTGPMSVNKTLTYGYQAASGLHYLHQQCIIHRDIKPDNMFLEKDTILVGDWGTATIFSEEIPIVTMWGVGTERYMPREQQSGAPRPASDQYALGLTLYELIIGELPQREEDWTKFAVRHQQVAQVLKKACAPAWQDRYNTMEAFAEALIQAKQSQFLNVSSDQTKPVPPHRGHRKETEQPHPSSQTVSSPITQPDSFLDTTPQLPNILTSAFSALPKRSSRPLPPLALIVVCVLVALSSWIGGNLVHWPIRPADNPTMVTPTLSTCFQTVKTLKDSGPGSFRQALQDIPQRQSCVISFASSVNGDLTLNRPLIIKQNVIIEAQNQKQITITPQTPQAAIIIEAGCIVSFLHLSFKGPIATNQPPQLDAFIQINSANVTLIDCDLSYFSSQGDGSALSNTYGHLTLEETTLEHNTSSDNGGAIYNLGLSSAGQETSGTLILDGSTLSSNTANYRGGGIYNVGGLVQVSGGSIRNNQTLYNDDEIEGGGAIASWDGMLSVSEAIFDQNAAQGYGGGILLVGTNAQISSSRFRSNKTVYESNSFIQVHGEGGGVAAETDRDNNELSHLDLIRNNFQNNINSFPTNGPSSTNDFAGTVILSDPGCRTSCEITTEPQTQTSSIKNFLGYLRIDDFSQPCQRKSPFTSAVPASPEDGTIVCVASNGLSEPFAKVEQKPDIQSAVQVLCQSRWPHKMNVQARLFNYWDPLSWQCFENEQPLGQNVTRDDINSSFCSQVYPGSSVILLGGTSPTAYGWSCQLNATLYRVKMDAVCQKRTGGNPSAISVLNPKNFIKSDGWQCWGTR